MALRKLELMHKRFGVCAGKTCGTCKHLTSHFYDKRYFKCTVYGESASEATDWAKRWEACGCYNQDYAGPKVIYFVKHAPRPPEPVAECEGQQSIFEEE